MSDTFMAAYERAEARNDLVHKYEWGNDTYKSIARVNNVAGAVNAATGATGVGTAIYYHKKAKKAKERGADEELVDIYKRRKRRAIAGSVVSGLAAASSLGTAVLAKRNDKQYKQMWQSNMSGRKILAHMTTERGKDGKNTYTFDPDEKVYTMDASGKRAHVNSTEGGIPAPKKNYKPLAIGGGVTGAAALAGGVAAAVAVHRKKKKKQREEEAARNAKKGGSR